MADMGERIKLVVVGDCAVGKTCLLLVYANGSYPEDVKKSMTYTSLSHLIHFLHFFVVAILYVLQYVPTVFENYAKVIKDPKFVNQINQSTKHLFKKKHCYYFIIFINSIIIIVIIICYLF